MTSCHLRTQRGVGSRIREAQTEIGHNQFILSENTSVRLHRRSRNTEGYNLSKDISKQADTDRLIRLKEVLHHLPISKSTWWAGVRTGRYPAPVKLGSRLTCWRLADILTLVKAGRSAMTNSTPVKDCRAGLTGGICGDRGEEI
jgi:prophage regulatory protein